MQIWFREFFCFRDKVFWLVDEKLRNLKIEKENLEQQDSRIVKHINNLERGTGGGYSRVKSSKI